MNITLLTILFPFTSLRLILNGVLASLPPFRMEDGISEYSHFVVDPLNRDRHGENQDMAYLQLQEFLHGNEKVKCNHGANLSCMKNNSNCDTVSCHDELNWGKSVSTETVQRPTEQLGSSLSYDPRRNFQGNHFLPSAITQASVTHVTSRDRLTHALRKNKIEKKTPRKLKHMIQPPSLLEVMTLQLCQGLWAHRRFRRALVVKLHGSLTMIKMFPVR